MKNKIKVLELGAADTLVMGSGDDESESQNNRVYGSRGE